MSKPRQYFLVAVHAFFIQDGKVLLCERANTGYKDGFFSVPAGHVDSDETIWTAMQREVQEEVGVTVPQILEPAHVMHRNNHADVEERIDYFFVIKDWEGEISNCEPEKCARVEWFPIDGLPQNTIPYVRFGFEQIQNNTLFSEFEE